MSGGELERIADLASEMSINYNTGAYHKPVALIWALDRARRGLPRLVTADAARQNLDELLDSITGSTNNASWPWLKLANDLEDLWIVQGADPAGDPPREFVAGWSRAAFAALADNPSETERLACQRIWATAGACKLGRTRASRSPRAVPFRTGS